MSDKVKVEFDVTISKSTGEISIKMKDGMCKIKMQNSNTSLSEVLNMITMGQMGADAATIQTKLNEYGKEGVAFNTYSEALTNPTVGEAKEVPEETEGKEKVALGNV